MARNATNEVLLNLSVLLQVAIVLIQSHIQPLTW